MNFSEISSFKVHSNKEINNKFNDIKFGDDFDKINKFEKKKKKWRK